MRSEPNSSSVRVGARRTLAWLPFMLIGLGTLLLVSLVVILFYQPGVQNIVPPRIGTPLNNFSLLDIQGHKVQLSDYLGKVVLINAWATWCPPCRAEMPDLNAYYQAHHNDGFVVLAVNAGEAQADAAAFAQNSDLTFPVLLDSDYHLLDGLNIHDYPTSIVVGRDGKVKAIHIGMYRPEELAVDVTPLLTQ
jgi:cytochrome c biogenesis protein CcmG, thiol:disulfide interchange protein DsbE